MYMHLFNYIYTPYSFYNFIRIFPVCRNDSRFVCDFSQTTVALSHDDVIKWKKIPRYWPFVRGIHRSPVNSPQKGQWRGALMSSSICALNTRLNKHEAGDLGRQRTHYDVIVMTNKN